MPTSHEGTASSPALQLYLLSIRGTLSPPSLQAACTVHNQTAGNPAGVAAARALGDLSHMVYVPTDQQGDASSELLVLDLWQSIEGLNTFFADPQVQAGGGMIFSDRDPQVWVAAGGCSSYHLPAPVGNDQRFIGVARGTVHSHEAARAQHNALSAEHVATARQRGIVSHQAYFRLAEPGTPESLEFFLVDSWMSGAGMHEHYADPAFLRSFDGLFSAPPDASTWKQPAGTWTEW